MDQFIQFFGSALLGLIGAITVYFKVRSERKETKSVRDKDSLHLHDTILKHEFELTKLKDDFAHQHNINEDLNKQIVELAKAVSTFSVAVDNLIKTVDELKDEVKEMRKK